MARWETIAEFLSSESWYKTSNGGEVSHDTKDFIYGSSSLKLTTPISSSGAVIAKTRISLDSVKNLYCVSIKSADFSEIESIWVQFENQSGDKYLRMNIMPDARALRDGDWNDICFSYSDLTSEAGSIRRSEITHMSFRVNGNKTKVQTVHFDNLRVLQPSVPSKVVVCFDDGHKTDITTAKPIMDKYGIPGTSYIIKNKLDYQTDGYMDLEDLKILQDAGWAIGSHASPDMTTLTEEQVHKEFSDIVEFLGKHHFKARKHFALPMGRYNKDVIKIARQHFDSCRTINVGGETVYNPDPYKLRVVYVTQTSQTNKIVETIKKDAAKGCLYIVVFHRIAATATSPEDVTVSNFETIMRGISASKIMTTTIDKVFEKVEV